MSDWNASDNVVRQMVEWAEGRDSVRAMILTSTRAKPNAVVDAFSDYDVVLIVRDIRPYDEDKSWIADFGEELVTFWDPVQPFSAYGLEWVGNVVQYADGLKIDFTVWPVELFRQFIATSALPHDLDDGYAVLLDKDHLTDGMRAPTYAIYVPVRPTEVEFQKHVADFFSDAPYVAKCLLRDELLPVKWCLDYDMKHVYLRPVLDWYLQRDQNWSLPAGNLGKALKKWLPPALWSELEGCYAGAGIADNWQALFRTMALFRRVAMEVADDLGYVYPLELDERVVNHVRRMKDVGH